jgi:hypothetical protein
MERKIRQRRVGPVANTRAHCLDVASMRVGTALCSCPTETWHIGKIDPIALRVQEIFRSPYTEGFGAATVAVQIGKEIWIGTNRGDRIGRFPAP